MIFFFTKRQQNPNPNVTLNNRCLITMLILIVQCKQYKICCSITRCQHNPLFNQNTYTHTIKVSGGSKCQQSFIHVPKLNKIYVAVLLISHKIQSTLIDKICQITLPLWIKVAVIMSMHSLAYTLMHQPQHHQL